MAKLLYKLAQNWEHAYFVTTGMCEACLNGTKLSWKRNMLTYIANKLELLAPVWFAVIICLRFFSFQPELRGYIEFVLNCLNYKCTYSSTYNRQ